MLFARSFSPSDDLRRFDAHIRRSARDLEVLHLDGFRDVRVLQGVGRIFEDALGEPPQADPHGGQKARQIDPLKIKVMIEVGDDQPVEVNPMHDEDDRGPNGEPKR